MIFIFIQNLLNGLYDLLYSYTYELLHGIDWIIDILRRISPTITGLFLFFPPPIYLLLVTGVTIVIALRIIGRSE